MTLSVDEKLDLIMGMLESLPHRIIIEIEESERLRKERRKKEIQEELDALREKMISLNEAAEQRLKG